MYTLMKPVSGGNMGGVSQFQTALSVQIVRDHFVVSLFIFPVRG